MWRSIKKLFWISRPVSWPNTAYPFAAGYLISGGQIDLTLIIGTLFFLIPYNLLMYGINDVFDYESDIRNPRKGGIEGMKEQKSFHPTIIRAALVLPLPFVIFLLLQGTLAAKASLVILLFFVVAYSLKYLRFKERPVLDSITSSFHFVGPLVYALLLIGDISKVWPILLAFFLWGIASHAFGAVQDIIPDRQANLRSIATAFGAKWTVRCAAILYLMASILILSQGFPALLVGLMGFIYIINIAPYVSISDLKSTTTNIAWRRFIFLNLATGFVTTLVLIYYVVTK